MDEAHEMSTTGVSAVRVRGFCVGLAALLGTIVPANAVAGERELAVAADETVEVEVATVALAQPSATPVVLLREPEASKIVPIFIGTAQARSILRALRGVDTPRPMSHDLMADLVERFDGRLQRVYVDDLEDQTFLGMLELAAAAGDDTVRVDARPSDAIALALRAGAPIHIAPAVIEATATVDYRALGQEQVVTAAGITVMAPKEQLRRALDLPDRDGLVVTRAVGPAAGAGLAAGALILEVNGERPTSPMDFLRLVRATPDGGELKLRYWHEGEIAAVSVPTAVPDDPGRAATPAF
jgi:bifunctional DNase/RNase